MSGIYVSEVYRHIPGFAGYFVSNLDRCFRRKNKGQVNDSRMN